MFIFSINIEEVQGVPTPSGGVGKESCWFCWRGILSFSTWGLLKPKPALKYLLIFVAKSLQGREKRLCFTLQVIRLYKFWHSYTVSDCKRKTWHKTSGIDVVNEGFGKTNRVINELMGCSGSRAKGAATFTTSHQLLFSGDQRHFHCPALQKISFS